MVLATRSLSGRELEVLWHAAGGKSNKRNALKLDISEETVKAHMKSILSKLMANDRTQAEDQIFRPTALRCGTLCARPAFIRSAGNDQMGGRADAHTLRRECKKNGTDNWAAFRILVERVSPALRMRKIPLKRPIHLSSIHLRKFPS
jgi:DNA-binding CsgD family transcriptional regulator